ncbi:hypothetical protein ACEPAH_8500 [Sanghuangporus vaninii]
MSRFKELFNNLESSMIDAVFSASTGGCFVGTVASGSFIVDLAQQMIGIVSIVENRARYGSRCIGSNASWRLPFTLQRWLLEQDRDDEQSAQPYTNFMERSPKQPRHARMRSSRLCMTRSRRR